MKEQGHTLVIVRHFGGVTEAAILHPDGCPTLSMEMLGHTVESYECVTGRIVASIGVDDIDDWRELPEGEYPIAVETEPSDWPGATDAYLMRDQ